jgi:murein DD-endopeptidase MepM/ murein hydrolase activator NlpD
MHFILIISLFLMSNAGNFANSVINNVSNNINAQNITNDTQTIKWQFPLPQPVKILREFNHQEIDFYEGHRGVDLFAPVGTKVYAPLDGIITLNRKVFTRNVLLIDHNNGYVSNLESLDSPLKVGTFVKQGQLLGVINNFQIHSENSLYWGVRKDDDKYVNPVILVNNVYAKLIE